MRYRAIVGHSDKELYLAMECSGCGVNLRNYTDVIKKLKLKYCPECGRKLAQRKPPISYAKICLTHRKEATTDTNIKTPQDALEWLECRIHEEAEADGEMTNEHAIQLAFIQNMLAKFPRRHCDTMSESACAVYFDALYNGNRDGVCMATTEREKNIHRYYCKYSDWLFATTKAKGDTK